VAAHLRLGDAEEVFACESDAAGDLGGGWKQAQEGEGGGGFAGAGFADEAERLAGGDGEGDAIDGGALAEGDAEVFYFKQRGGVHEMMVAEIVWTGLRCV
jgi:hypothetical protein